jgi:glycolate oxidase iron-sulfur subunit
VARGKLNLVGAWQEGRLPQGEVFREVLSLCLLCGACTDKCAVGLDVPEILKGVRAQIRLQQGPQWNAALLLAHLTWHVPRLIPAAAPLAPLINRLKAWVGEESRLLWRLSPHLSMALQTFPNLARRPFRAQAPRLVPGRGPLKVAFFVGCGLEALYPKAGLAFLSICQGLGIEVLTPPGQGCCGLMADSIGEADLALAQARRFVEEFSAIQVDVVVTACASCAHQLKRLGSLLADTPAADAAQRLGAKVREVSEFLVQEAGYHPAPRPLPQQVAFHDPCHLHRGQGIIQEPRELLREALKSDVLEAAEKKCCGFGGAFGLMFPQFSQELSEERGSTFRKVGATLVATSCTGCLVQLSARSTLPAVHLLELIA